MGAVNFSVADGLLKTVYEDSGYLSLVPEVDMLATDFPYNQKDSPGGSFKYSVQVLPAGGYTYGGTDSDVLTLATAIAPNFKQAEVKPYTYGFKQQMGYSLFNQLGRIKSKSVQKQAFIDGTGAMMESMKESASFQREHQLYIGQSLLGIGVFYGTVVSGGGTTTQVWAMSAATFNFALLSKVIGMRVDMYDATGVTKRNATSTVTLSAIDEVNRRVTLVGTSSTELDAIVATDALHIEGSISNAMVGMHNALQLASGVTYLGLSGTTYPLWRSNQYSFGSAAVSVDRIGQMVNKVVARGQKGDLNLYINPKGAHDLQQSISGQIMLNNGPTKFDNDVGSLMVAGRRVNLRVYDYCYPGYTYLVPSKNCCRRIGPEDLSFRSPADDGYFHNMQGDLGVELKCYGQQALVVRNPAHCCYGYGIVNSVD